MFEDATFHSRNILPSQTPKWMLLTLAINLTVLTAMLLVPLLYPGTLSGHLLPHIVYVDPAQPPIATSVQSHPQSNPSPTQSAQLTRNPLQLPQIPSTNTDPGPEAPAAFGLDLSSGTGSGNAASASAIFGQTNPPVHVKAATPTRVTLSRGVSGGLLISQTKPNYPAIARSAHIAGTVVLAATISTTGHIENLQVLSGPPTLRQAAIDAVKTWQYRPYKLNDRPVEVETTINILFSLGSQ